MKNCIIVNDREDAIFKFVKEVLIHQTDAVRCLNIIKNFSNELFRHSINVALLALILGQRVGIGSGKQKELFIAGLLHDYGKLLIPKDILEKRGALTVDERRIMELHPAAGFLSLKRDTVFSDKIFYAVLDHHEKADGSGYGSRKAGNSISDYAKIISIADVYDAMVSDRAYRKAIEINSVKDYLSMNAGRSFDYNLAMSFIDILNEMPFELLKNEHNRIILSILDLYDGIGENSYLYKLAER